jgi:hypothetical protein
MVHFVAPAKGGYAVVRPKGHPLQQQARDVERRGADRDTGSNGR